MRGTIAAAGRISEADLTAEDRERLVAAFRGWRGS
jgi:hypothetical protein